MVSRLLWMTVAAGMLSAAAALAADRADGTYGCEGNPTGDPIGGGAGYRDIFATGDCVATDREQFAEALKKARPGQVVFVPHGAEIDLSGLPSLSLPPGVTLAGTRGKSGSPGARLFATTFGRMFATAGAGVRLTGLRFEGACAGTELVAASAYFLAINHDDARVDNCEISGFNVTGISVGKGAFKTRIDHNSIHHCQRGGYGYGVAVGGGADARIIANTFDFCRHHVASSGEPGAGYEAAWNLILENATASHFDMHGGRDRGDSTDIAGDWMHIHHNTFRSPHVHVGIRGTPSAGADIHNNWFVRPVEVSVRSTGNTRAFDNAFGPEKTPQARAIHFEAGEALPCEAPRCRYCRQP